MNPFDALLADFAQKTGLEFGGPGTDSLDLEADGVAVCAQYRAERDDCVVFSLPLEDTEPDGPMLRCALEFAANGGGTDGFFLGLKEGMFMLSAVLPLGGALRGGVRPTPDRPGRGAIRQGPPSGLPGRTTARRRGGRPGHAGHEAGRSPFPRAAGLHVRRRGQARHGAPDRTARPFHGKRHPGAHAQDDADPRNIEYMG